MIEGCLILETPPPGWSQAKWNIFKSGSILACPRCEYGGIEHVTKTRQTFIKLETIPGAGCMVSAVEVRYQSHCTKCSFKFTAKMLNTAVVEYKDSEFAWPWPSTVEPMTNNKPKANALTPEEQKSLMQELNTPIWELTADGAATPPIWTSAQTHAANVTANFVTNSGLLSQQIEELQKQGSQLDEIAKQVQANKQPDEWPFPLPSSPDSVCCYLTADNFYILYPLSANPQVFHTRPLLDAVICQLPIVDIIKIQGPLSFFFNIKKHFAPSVPLGPATTAKASTPAVPAPTRQQTEGRAGRSVKF
jgi:hypothetical protein